MSLSKCQIGPEAHRDLEEHGKYLTLEVGYDLANRFVDPTRAIFTTLGPTPPHIGTQAHSRNPAFAELRKWRVSGFPAI